MPSPRWYAAVFRLFQQLKAKATNDARSTLTSRNGASAELMLWLPEIQIVSLLVVT